MAQSEEKKTKIDRIRDLVDDVFVKRKKDPIFRSGLKKASSPTTATQSWFALAQCGVDLEDRNARLIYSLVLSSIAGSNMDEDGESSFGKAFFDACGDNSSGELRFKRVLSCDSIEEVVGVLRPALRLIESRKPDISYSSLLFDLEKFRYPESREEIKAKWANDFYAGEKEEDPDVSV